MKDKNTKNTKHAQSQSNQQERGWRMQWITLAEAVAMLNKNGIKITPPTLLKLIKNKEVEGQQLGNRYFTTEEAMQKIINPGKANEAK